MVLPRVLVAAAFAPELAHLRELLGDGLGREVAGTPVLARAIGIGLVASGVGASARLSEAPARACVLIGTCGAYAGSGGLAVGALALARTVRLVEPAVLEGRAAIPAPMPAMMTPNAALSAALGHAAGELGCAATPCDVATTVAVTTDDALAAHLATASGCQIEHLEAFAVATACAAYGVPFAALFGVANRVGSTGREEWRTGHRAAGDLAARVVERWLASGAPA